MIRLYQHRANPNAPTVTILRCDDETARILSSLLCTARPQGDAECNGLRVIVDGPAAEPRPSHHPVDG